MSTARIICKSHQKPIDLIITHNRAKHHLKNKDFERALSCAKEMHYIDPNNIDADRINATSYYHLFKNDNKNDYLEYALEACNHILNKNNDEKYYYLRSQIYQEQQQYKKALNDIAQAIKLNNKLIEYHIHRNNLENLNLIKKIDNYFSRHPANYKLLLKRAEAYVALNQPIQALYDFQDCLNLAPDNKESRKIEIRIDKCRKQWGDSTARKLNFNLAASCLDTEEDSELQSPRYAKSL